MLKNSTLTELEKRIIEDSHLTLTPPRIRQFAEPELLPERNDFVMSSGIDITPGGRLWISWFGGGDNEKAYLMLAKSDDNGLSWSEPQFIIKEPPTPNGFPRSVLVGNVWTQPDGKFRIFFSYSLGSYDGRAGVWTAVCDNPDSEQPSWSEPKRIWHGFTINKPIVTQTGEWLLGISLWRKKRIFGFHDMPCEYDNYQGHLFQELDNERKAHVFASSDCGKSWQKRGGIRLEERDFDEQVIVERQDYSLLMYLRTCYGIIENGLAETESYDAGITWRKPEKSSLPHTSSRIFASRLKSGRLLIVKHGGLEEPVKVRSHLTAYISEDDGKSWSGGLLLDERVGISYPDGFQAPDGRIFITYDFKRINGEILLAVFSEEDVLACEPSSETQLKISVKQTKNVENQLR